MLCQNCGKREANVKYTQIINGVKKQISVCSECAVKLGIDGPDFSDFSMSFNSFLGDFFNDYAQSSLLPSFESDVVKCKKCGMSYEDFIKTGMFGCSNCYETFSNPINSLVRNLHGTTKHIGRSPKKIGDAISSDKNKNKNSKSEEVVETEKKQNNIEKKKQDLQKELDKAIKEERYEDAAKIRDQIKEMNK